LVVFFFALVVVSSVWAQEKTVDVGRVFALVPKPGMTKQFEEGPGTRGRLRPAKRPATIFP
jgi:hypothetical protein